MTTLYRIVKQADFYVVMPEDRGDTFYQFVVAMPASDGQAEYEDNVGEAIAHLREAAEFIEETEADLTPLTGEDHERACRRAEKLDRWVSAPAT